MLHSLVVLVLMKLEPLKRSFWEVEFIWRWMLPCAVSIPWVLKQSGFFCFELNLLSPPTVDCVGHWVVVEGSTLQHMMSQRVRKPVTLLMAVDGCFWL